MMVGCNCSEMVGPEVSAELNQSFRMSVRAINMPLHAIKWFKRIIKMRICTIKWSMRAIKMLKRIIHMPSRTIKMSKRAIEMHKSIINRHKIAIEWSARIIKMQLRTIEMLSRPFERPLQRSICPSIEFEKGNNVFEITLMNTKQT